jgi:ligand-binding sensor domain-containing protein
MLMNLSYKRQFYYSLFLLLFSALKLIAQPNSHPFLHLDSKNGLSSGHVNAILKDKQGFMWFCTDAGLNKYDGYNFKVFTNNKKDAFSISNDYVKAILEDSNGDIWVGTESGLDKFNKHDETFTYYSPGKAIMVNHILIDSKGLFWLSTGEGFYQFNTVNNSFRYFLHDPNNKNSLSDNYVYKIIEDTDNTYWIATKNGLNRYDSKHNLFTIFNTTTTPKINSSWVRTIYKDHLGTIWLGSVGGEYYTRRSTSILDRYRKWGH